ncbi:hypothetical protein RDV64_17500 [Acuticoccus sp. MNP-M23]|uniref:hypothetical protein n=1 Tax=Acuticoccus sp. MNP-M23 TaxID=3072793 RepID=UPI0028157E0A|nr:hypothetical protein [Acuticoccus sp. MNP-M23]WMS41845.1 hypothetical protein RDV64_17500 [Acuticoccus sp. MNP-M23]
MNTSAAETVTIEVVDEGEVSVDAQTMQVNDWLNPAWGGGYVAEFEVTVPDDVPGGHVSAFIITGALAHGTLVNAWISGHPAALDVDASGQSLTACSVGQDYQVELTPGDTVRIGVQVEGAGYEAGAFGFTFEDLDLEDDAGFDPAAPASLDGATIRVETLSSWDTGGVVEIDLTNDTGALITDVDDLVFDLTDDSDVIRHDDAWGFEWTPNGLAVTPWNGVSAHGDIAPEKRRRSAASSTISPPAAILP